jgi:hypothetical protein
VLKVIALGDVHASFPLLWEALRASYAAGDDGLPTAPVREGRYRVVLIGDLVHPKNFEAYEELTGLDGFDHRDPGHLQSAAEAQLEGLYQLKRYADAGNGNVTVLLGNHDAAAVHRTHLLGTSTGLKHAEFDPRHGGTELPEDLAAWMRSWPRSLNLDGVHFAHAGPTPGMASYDDFFYGDADPKTWWRAKPHLVRAAGHSFGVYGHTPMPHGIHVNDEEGFAMIDALEHGEYLEVLLRDGGEFAYQVSRF